MRVSGIVLTIMAGVCLPVTAGHSAGTIIENVRGYTWQDGAVREFSALVFTDDGRVVATYRSGERPADPGLRRIDGGGATLIPGLIDAHGHVLSFGQARRRVDLVGTRSRAEAVSRVAAFAAANPGSGWILGRGWNQELWDDRDFPTAADLDVLALGRPVWLGRIDGHAAWANSRAMHEAGVDRETPDPPGGRIGRDADGNATGVFIDKAQALVDRIVPASTRADDLAALRLALTELAAVGLTGVHDAGVDLRTAALYRELLAAGELPIRVYAMLEEGIYRRFGKPLTDDGTGYLAIQSVKVYLDGALGSRGAALIEPYDDKPGDRGLLFGSAAEFAALVRQATKRGFQVNVHAIGDDANRVALDAFQKYGAGSPLRHRIEHAQVIRLADMPRFASLGVIASVQPTHATSDKNMARDRIGPERLRGAYAWRRLLASGARLAGGSDFPVEPAPPLYGIHAAVTRQDRDDEPAGGWHGDQRLTVAEALRLFTLDAAYAARQERNLGSLEPGKRADFVLLDRNIFEIPAREIWRVAVRETWVNGICIYPAAD